MPRGGFSRFGALVVVAAVIVVGFSTHTFVVVIAISGAFTAMMLMVTVSIGLHNIWVCATSRREVREDGGNGITGDFLFFAFRKDFVGCVGTTAGVNGGLLGCESESTSTLGTWFATTTCICLVPIIIETDMFYTVRWIIGSYG